MEVIMKNTEFPLAQGTGDERAVPMKSSMALGNEYDITFAALFKIHKAIAQQTAGRIHTHPTGLGSLVQAIWLLWCYTSHDVGALQQQIDELKDENVTDSDERVSDVTELQELVKTLTAKVDDLQQQVGALRSRDGGSTGRTEETQ